MGELNTKDNPAVAIIILNWNGLTDTLECISSLQKLNYKNRQIIVVDNNSNEDLTPLKEMTEDVLLIRNKENYGYAQGNNVGIRKALELGCKYCWILNNDTTVERDSLACMVRELENERELAAVTNLILYYDDPSLAWFAGGFFDKGLPAIRAYFEKINVAEEKKTGPVVETEYLCGCSFVARTAALEAIGGFDEGYFCYVEDVDLSLTLVVAGYNIGYVPGAVVWHKVSRSSGNHSPIKLYYKHRNVIYFLKKFDAPASVLFSWWWTSLRFFLSLAVKHRNYRASRYLFLGLVDAVRNKRGRLSSL